MISNNTENTNLKALMKLYSNVFDFDRILEKVDISSLTDEERKDLLSIPLSLLINLQDVNNLINWLLLYREESSSNHVSDKRLLQTILSVNSLIAELDEYIYRCSSNCVKGDFPCIPANKLFS